MKYTFNQLKEDLCIGREIEFVYNTKLYSLTHSTNGWIFCCEQKLLSSYHSNVHDFIQEIINCVVDDSSLEEIINHQKYMENTLFVF